MRNLSKYIVTALVLAACDELDVHEVNDLDQEVAQADWIHAISSGTEARPGQDETDVDRQGVSCAHHECWR